eukprot:m.34231 g.34231  ORF g.34231 m.34231 type:complete len:56 (-) comp16950_c1_seq1:47-214(-)
MFYFWIILEFEGVAKDNKLLQGSTTLNTFALHLGFRYDFGGGCAIVEADGDGGCG